MGFSKNYLGPMGQCRSAEDAVRPRPEEDLDDSQYSSRHFLSRRHASLSLNREIASIQIMTSMGFDEISAERALGRFQGSRAWWNQCRSNMKS